MKRIVGAVMCAVFVASFSLTSQTSAQSFEQSRLRNKVEFQQKSDEMRRDFEYRRHLQQHRVHNTSRPGGGTSTSFRASRAEHPGVTLAKFLGRAQNAQSMNSLMRFLPSEKQEQLRKLQAQYDPAQAAEKRKWFKERNSDLTPDQLDHLTQSPYDGELKMYKRIANNIIDLMDVEIKGDKAYISVSTKRGAVINSVRYEYSTAKIVMVGEGSSWRFYSYEDSDWHHKYVPE